MFTGIIEEIGDVVSIHRGARSATLSLRGSVLFSDLGIGDSVAVNGVCLTVSKINGHTFETDATPETLDRTSLGALSAGSRVNLERALSSSARFGGHIVTGHVDGTAVISAVRRDENAVIMEFSCDAVLMANIIEKGSVAVDGISLTVAALTAGSFRVSVIPHTGRSTTLLGKKTGDIVNIETDIIGKYVERFVSRRNVGRENPCIMTEEYLRGRGF